MELNVKLTILGFLKKLGGGILNYTQQWFMSQRRKHKDIRKYFKLNHYENMTNKNHDM